MTMRDASWCRVPLLVLLTLLLTIASGPALAAGAAPADGAPQLAPTPPMGWNDWAHYQCNFNSQTILSNAKALVKTGLAARGYNTVTIDDCWMQKTRDASGNLQIDRTRFPQGAKPVGDAIHALGLKFGIYEDAGYATCGKFAGSGVPKGGGNDHFLQDAKLFASWGVDYLKLDGCNVYVPKGESMDDAYRKAYAAQHAALNAVGQPIVFSESAPAYFQDTPAWYDVLVWVRDYGQLWREGTDIDTYDDKKPNASRFASMLWNYAYNLPLGRFQKPGNWNDADFIIGGDSGMTLAETRTQLALWSMMSAPLILSSDLEKLSPESVSILGNQAVLAIDQDGLGRMATLTRHSAAMDVLFKPLKSGDYAVAVFNRGAKPLRVELHPSDFGFASKPGCQLNAQNLWTGSHSSSGTSLQAEVAPHDTEIWRIHASPFCGEPTHTGTISMIANGKSHNLQTYSRCLAAPGSVRACNGASAESWTLTSGALRSEGRCLAVAGDKPVMQACSAVKEQRWNYTLLGNLVSSDGKCLSGSSSANERQTLSVRTCGHNQPGQIWSLPN
jgi:alpha-galactosidase